MKDNRKNFKWIIFSIGIITILVIALIITTNIITNKIINNERTENGWKMKKIVFNEEDYQETVTTAGDMVARIPKWEELPIILKFSVIKYDERNYNAINITVEEKKLGTKIANLTLTKYDEITGINHTNNAECYTLNGFPIECVIVVKYEGTNEYYIANNMWYKPKTLGDFMENLHLKENVDFGTIHYKNWYTDEKGNKKYEEVEFPDVDDEVIWNMLFDDTTVENVYKDGEYHEEIMGISTNMPLFGYENISVSVSKDGYLQTNIWSTGKTFYIGEEKVQKFVDYVSKKYEGYKTVYVDEDGKILTEEMIEEKIKEKNKKDTNKKDTNTEGKIVMFDLINNVTEEFTINKNNNNDNNNAIDSIEGMNSTEPYNPSKN